MENIPLDRCPEFESRLAGLRGRISQLAESGRNATILEAVYKSQRELAFEYVDYRANGRGCSKPLDPLKLLEMFP